MTIEYAAGWLKRDRGALRVVCGSCGTVEVLLPEMPAPSSWRCPECSNTGTLEPWVPFGEGRSNDDD